MPRAVMIRLHALQSKSFTWSVELRVPVNHRTGNSIGVVFGFDLYLDDIAPHGFGAPLFR